ncbi:MAG TPA: hypothetical protein VIY08_06690 [Candidatus Nitrosocosmicus sp.]
MLSSDKTALRNRNTVFLQNIQLLIGIMVFGIVVYSSITIVAFGVLSKLLPTISDNLTLNMAINVTNIGISLNQAGNFNESIAFFNKALSIDSKNILALTEKANALGGLEKYPESLIYYDKVLPIDPKNVPALDNKGLSLHLGNYTQAIPYYDKALTLDPKYTLALIGKGYALDNL